MMSYAAMQQDWGYENVWIVEYSTVLVSILLACHTIFLRLSRNPCWEERSTQAKDYQLECFWVG